LGRDEGILEGIVWSGNQAWITRNQLLALKHTGKIQAYIKEFTGLMLEIKDMSKKTNFSTS
jgi:hypothetical protein